MKKVFIFILLILIIPIMAFSCEKNFTIEGQILDKDTNLPIPNVKVISGENILNTDVNGIFHINEAKEGTYSFQCSATGYYENNVTSELNIDNATINIILEKIKSSFSGNIYEVLPWGNEPSSGALIKIEDYSFMTKEDGTFKLENLIPGDYEVIISSDRLEELKTSITLREGNNNKDFVLNLNPKTIYSIIFDFLIKQDYEKEYLFVHSSQYEYYPKEDYIKDQQKSDKEGYSIIDYEIGEVTIIPHWEIDEKKFGTFKFDNVAVVQVKLITSAPMGGKIVSEGASHLVKENGVWKWFPINTRYNF